MAETDRAKVLQALAVARDVRFTQESPLYHRGMAYGLGSLATAVELLAQALLDCAPDAD